MCVNDESALKVIIECAVCMCVTHVCVCDSRVCVCVCDSRGCGGGCDEWGRNERGDRSDRSLANRETRRLLLPFTPSPSPSTAQVHLTRGGCRNEANNTSTLVLKYILYVAYMVCINGKQGNTQLHSLLLIKHITGCLPLAICLFLRNDYSILIIVN